MMEDERAMKEIVPIVEEKPTESIAEETVDETSTETLVTKEDSPSTTDMPPERPKEPVLEIASPPTTPSTAPSSPILESSIRSISPISLPSTESSHPESAQLLDKIALLESQLTSAHSQIEEYKNKLVQVTPFPTPIPTSVPTSSAVEFPFTFTAPRTPRSPRPSLRSRSNGSLRHSVRRPKKETSDEIVVEDKTKDRRELMEGVCAALGVVVLGWMGMWFINHLVERGGKVVK